MHMNRSLAVAALFALSLSAPTSAQDYGLGGMDNLISQTNTNMMTTSTIIAGASFRASLKRMLNVRSDSPNTPRAESKAAPVSAAALVFKPSAAVRLQSQKQFFETMRSVDPKAADMFEARFASRTIFQQMEPEMNKVGLRTDNIADAMALWLIHIWMGANGVSEDPPVAQMKAVRTQLSDVLMANPELASTSNAQKQELADSLLLNAVIMGAIIGDPQAKTPEGKAMVQKLMVEISGKLGFDLSTVRLTDAGFAA
jgi:hypothetical protein